VSWHLTKEQTSPISYKFIIMKCKKSIQLDRLITTYDIPINFINCICFENAINV